MAAKLTPTSAGGASPDGGYMAYSSNNDEEDASTSCGTAMAANNKPDWMSGMGGRFRDAKVGEVIWPGTHDSGCHCAEFDFNKVVHDHWLRFVGTHLLRCLGQSPKQFASEWGRTQALSIRGQLDHGVRYIDLRVSKCVQDNEYYIVHSFCGPSLRDILDEIHSFFSRYQEECLLLEVIPISGIDHVELHSVFERRLGEFLLKREPESYGVSPVSFTISQLIAKGRIVLFYKLPAMYGYMDNVRCFWDNRYIHSGFIHSLEPSVKESFQLEKFTDFASRFHQPQKHKNIFHFMYALTPTLGEILKSSEVSKYLVSSESRTKFRSLQDCAQNLNPRLGKFVERVQQHMVSERCQDIGMIVSVDFVEESDLLQQVIAMNSSKFK